MRTNPEADHLDLVDSPFRKREMDLSPEGPVSTQAGFLGAQGQDLVLPRAPPPQGSAVSPRCRSPDTAGDIYLCCWHELFVLYFRYLPHNRCDSLGRYLINAALYSAPWHFRCSTVWAFAPVALVELVPNADMSRGGRCSREEENRGHKSRQEEELPAELQGHWAGPALVPVSRSVLRQVT